MVFHMSTANMTTEIYEATKLYEATMLYEASLAGNVEALNSLLLLDELIVHRLSLTRLHMTTMRGFRDVALIILTGQPKLITALDFLRRTPLHLASVFGNLDMVRTLVWERGGRDVCCFQDQDGLTPLHWAIINKHLDVVKHSSNRSTH
ncbi:hypothetical protein QVD17_20559 [Tagetes erecta]|uniref:Uncharacterized protein n=1 Tax=Tagetes erecta TaxID=13708 RepID=A0AAD8KLQ6_TARER|nr:hypothetical protein QVD17_20559 [Tagetes erecta]